jgi:pyridinium-3,5-biscarboxylic acid mononucleotide sulfurtransferase
VRDLGDRASIEVDAGLAPAAAALPGLVPAVLGAGFEFAEVDPRGFRSGSMNERLAQPETLPITGMKRAPAAP